METTTLPPDVIESHIEAVQHPVHREHLHSHLGRLAEKHSVIDFIPDQSEETNVKTDIHTQSEMISHYFAEASSELGAEATEDQVWDKVFDKQMWELVKSDGEVDKESLAVNVLVGNLFAANGLPEADAQRFLQTRMWSVATFRRGLAIVGAANKNMGLCVATGQTDKPYASVVEQTQPHGALFMATDQAVDLKTVSIPVSELADASPERQAWFIGVMGANKNFSSVNLNMKYIPDTTALVEQIIASGRMSSDLLRNTPLGNDFSSERVVDLCFSLGKNPTYSIDVGHEPAELQSTVLNRMIELLPDSVSLGLDRFTNLPETDLRKLAESGFFKNNSYTNIGAFKNLSPGMIDFLKDSGLSHSKICESLSNFDQNDRKTYYDQLTEGYDSHVIFQYPDQFDFVDRADLLQAARDSRNMSTVSQYVSKYTDGTNQQLISELLDSGYGEAVAKKLGDMPNIDVEWFVGEADRHDDLKALLQSLPYSESIDHQELFDRILAREDAASILRYDIKLLTGLDKQATLDRLISGKLFDVITSKLDYFDGETRESIFNRIAENPEALVAVAESIYLFPFVDKAWLVDSLATNGSYDQITAIADDAIKDGVDPETIWSAIQDSSSAMYKMLYRVDGEFCKAIGVERVFSTLLDKGSLGDVAWQLDKTDNKAIHQMFLERCIEQRDASAIRQSLDKISIDKVEIIRQLCQSGFEAPLISWSDDPFFKDIATEDLPSQEALLGWGAHATLICNPERYPDVNRDEHYDSLINSNAQELLVKVLLHPNTTSAPAKAAQYLVGTERAAILRMKKDLFDKSVFTPELMEKYIATGDEAFLELYEYSGQKIEWVERGFAVFGKEAPPTILYAVRELEKTTEDPLPAQFAELSVRQRGQGGVEQLKRAYTNIRSELIHGTNTPEQLRDFVELATNNPIAKSIAKQLTRFAGAQWGRHGEDEWTRVLQDHLAVSAEIRPLALNFVPSSEYTVRTIDAKEFDPSKIDEDAANKFTSLRESLDLALEIAESPAAHRYERLFADSRSLLDTERARLATTKEGLQAQNKTKAVENIDRQISAIDNVRQMDTRQFLSLAKDNFQQLTSLNVKGLDQIIRAGSFARAIRKSPEAKAIAESLRGSKVSFDNLVALDNFVEHLVNNEVYSEYFRNDDARKAFIRNSDTTALRKQIAKTQSGQTSGQTSLQFIPSRGPLLELSGHIGDACWASKYESIAKEFPNVTAIGYLRNPGKNTERLVGAGLMIETTDQTTGKGVIVLRGTNPIENYINGVKVEDFFDALVSYAKSIAGDRRVAVVIDGGPGQAATNRPVLHSYLKEVVKDSKTVGDPVKLPQDSTFNGYVLSASGQRPHPVYYLN